MASKVPAEMARGTFAVEPDPIAQRDGEGGSFGEGCQGDGEGPVHDVVQQRLPLRRRHRLTQRTALGCLADRRGIPSCASRLATTLYKEPRDTR